MESNVQVIQKAFENFKKGNIPAIIDACTDDITWGSYENPSVPFAGTFRGKKGVQEFFTKLGEMVDYQDFNPREFYSQGDSVVVLGHHTGKVKRTGKTFDHDWAMDFKLRDSKVRSFFSFVDTLDHARAFGSEFEMERKEKIPTSGVKEMH